MNIFKPLAFHEYNAYGAILPYTIGMLVYLLDVLLTWYAEFQYVLLKLLVILLFNPLIMFA
jgi:hypothetical protein